MVMLSCALGVEIFNHEIQKQSSHLSFTFSELPHPLFHMGDGERALQKRGSRVTYDLYAWDPDFHVWNLSGLSPER